MSKIPQQIIPLVIIFALAITALIVARQLLVPDSFGDWGFYRADAVGEIASQEMQYAGANLCNECHDDIYEIKQESNHRGVSCEVCHGPAAKHTEEPDEFTPEIPSERNHCPLCHGYNPARPSGFPQILSVMHNPGQACMECHNPHAPVLPHPPENCSACHREIVSKKMVSHHATVDCVQCHETPQDHWSDPMQFRAMKPHDKSLCGTCHAEGAQIRRSVPKVDIATHGGRYLCWDCHYPHSPEAL